MHIIIPEKIQLKNHPTLNEKWLQEQIAGNPALIGLGDLILKDRERSQPRAGRIDLLLQDSELPKRYEVEIQLGKTDESHIIRTIEYWDIERRRYPQYDHCAVIIAEDITSRFLNVIGLFNGMIPLVAIQVKASKIREDIILDFTTILNQMTLGLVEEDEEQATTDRSYWETKGTKATVALADEILELIHEFKPELVLKYNKYYIGLSKNGSAHNFAVFRAKKGYLRLEIRLDESDEIQSLLDSASIDVMDYDSRWGSYRIRINKKDISDNKEVISQLLKMAAQKYES